MSIMNNICTHQVCSIIWLQLTLFQFSFVNSATDLGRIDRDICAIYETQDPSRKQQLIDHMHIYLITLRRYNTMIKKNCEETKEEACRLVRSGGPEFVKSHMFYSDEEQKLRYKLNFTDFEFQEYQYYRLDSETEWAELKEHIAKMDKESEKVSVKEVTTGKIGN